MTIVNDQCLALMLTPKEAMQRQQAAQERVHQAQRRLAEASIARTAAVHDVVDAERELIAAQDELAASIAQAQEAIRAHPVAEIPATDDCTIVILRDSLHHNFLARF